MFQTAESIFHFCRELCSPGVHRTGYPNPFIPIPGEPVLPAPEGDLDQRLQQFPRFLISFRSIARGFQNPQWGKQSKNPPYQKMLEMLHYAPRSATSLVKMSSTNCMTVCLPVCVQLSKLRGHLCTQDLLGFQDTCSSVEVGDGCVQGPPIAHCKGHPL